MQGRVGVRIAMALGSDWDDGRICIWISTFSNVHRLVWRQCIKDDACCTFQGFRGLPHGFCCATSERPIQVRSRQSQIILDAQISRSTTPCNAPRRRAEPYQDTDTDDLMMRKLQSHLQPHPLLRFLRSWGLSSTQSQLSIFFVHGLECTYPAPAAPALLQGHRSTLPWLLSCHSPNSRLHHSYALVSPFFLEDSSPQPSC